MGAALILIWALMAGAAPARDNSVAFRALHLPEAWSLVGRASPDEPPAVLVLDDGEPGGLCASAHGDGVVRLLQDALGSTRLGVARMAVVEGGDCPEPKHMARALFRAARWVHRIRRAGAPLVVVNISHEIVPQNAFLRGSDPAIGRGLHALTHAGAIVVLAVGNDGIFFSKRGLLAGMEDVLLVGALDHGGNAAWRANRWGTRYGPAVDLFAPGAGMQIARNGAPSTMDGTSAAAPLVSAVLALAARAAPTADVRCIVRALSATAVLLHGPGGATLRRPDAAALLRALASSSNRPCGRQERATPSPPADVRNLAPPVVTRARSRRKPRRS